MFIPFKKRKDNHNPLTSPQPSGGKLDTTTSCPVPNLPHSCLVSCFGSNICFLSPHGSILSTSHLSLEPFGLSISKYGCFSYKNTSFHCPPPYFQIALPFSTKIFCKIKSKFTATIYFTTSFTLLPYFPH